MTSTIDKRAGRGRPLWLGWLASLALAIGLAGCGAPEVETTYGRSRGQSINGTNTLSELIRDRGHPTRVAIRYNEVLADWAQVVVRFAPYPGPPSRAEADWLGEWLNSGPGRKLVYVPRDYEANTEFWARMLAATPPGTAAADRQRIQARRDEVRQAAGDQPAKAEHPAAVRDWFGTEPTNKPRPAEVTVCRQLAGPWADGVDPGSASLPAHEAIQADNNEDVLLTGDGKKLVVAWNYSNDESQDGSVLVVANGSFLLNAALLNPARRPLATRVVDWIGAGSSHVALVEGAYVLDEPGAGSSSTFHLLTVEPFGWIAAHLAVFGGLLGLAIATTLGRPRPEPLGEIERPSAHPVALGAILARTRQEAVARELITTYRRWRHPAPASPRTDPSPSSRRVPRA